MEAATLGCNYRSNRDGVAYAGEELLLDGLAHLVARDFETELLTGACRAAGFGTADYARAKHRLVQVMAAIRLPPWTPVAGYAGPGNGLFVYDADSGTVRLSELELDELAAALAGCAGVLLVARSAGGRGLWVLARGPVSPSASAYKVYHRRVLDSFPSDLRDFIAPAQGDITRSRFVAHDGGARFDWARDPVEIDPELPRPASVRSLPPVLPGGDDLLAACAYLKGVGVSCDDGYRVGIGAALYAAGYDIDRWRFYCRGSNGDRAGGLTVADYNVREARWRALPVCVDGGRGIVLAAVKMGMARPFSIRFPALSRLEELTLIVKSPPLGESSWSAELAAKIGAELPGIRVFGSSEIGMDNFHRVALMSLTQAQVSVHIIGAVGRRRASYQCLGAGCPACAGHRLAPAAVGRAWERVVLEAAFYHCRKTDGMPYADPPGADHCYVSLHPDQADELALAAGLGSLPAGADLDPLQLRDVLLRSHGAAWELSFVPALGSRTLLAGVLNGWYLERRAGFSADLAGMRAAAGKLVAGDALESLVSRLLPPERAVMDFSADGLA